MTEKRNLHWRCVEEETGLDRYDIRNIENYLGISESGAYFHEVAYRSRERICGADLTSLKKFVASYEERENVKA